MPNVFITGATGFIGQKLCEEMLTRCWKIKACVRKGSGKLLPAGIESMSIDSIETCPFKKEDFSEIDTVIHLAARVHILKESENDSLAAFRKLNVHATECLARTAAAAGVKRFIFMSSVKVNGEGSAEIYREDDPPDPKDAYGISKKEAEDVLRRIGRETGLEIVILRSPLVFGPGVKANFRQLMKIACLPLPLKNVDNQRSMIYLGNLVDAVLTCVTHPGAAGQTFLISDGHDISTPDLVRKLAEAMGRRAHLFSLPGGVLNILGKIAGKSDAIEKLTGSLRVDSSKIREVLGWKPPFTTEEGIAETAGKGKAC
ncbi:MAG: SDR family oxidoreductase [Candidatus Omnitrophota bacterium]